jgi:hypothetical protein
MRIAALGVVTCDRTTALRRCLESYAANSRDHDRAPAFIVVDDSRASETQERNRRATAEVAHRFGVSIRYAGRRDKMRFAAALAAECGVPVDVVRFGLMGDDRCSASIGANRNSLLLDTADSLAVSVDDDTSCRLAPAPGLEEGAAPCASYDPTEFFFFHDREAALGATMFGDTDFLALNETLLGSTAGQGRVVLTMPGLVGDSGMGSARHYFALTGASHDRLTESEEMYRSALRSRTVFRAVRRPTICAGSFFMSTVFGFDNRSLLPPFCPVQRNADGVFGLTLQQCVPGSHIGYLPWALLHAPPGRRDASPDALWSDANGIRMADIVIGCILATGMTGESDAARLTHLGARLRAIGSLEPREFDAFVRNMQQHRIAAFTALVSSRLHAAAPPPPYWTADAALLIERLTNAIAGEHFTVPRDLRDRYGIDAARALSQELVLKFGDLLSAWPDIVAAAIRLRSRREGLARDVAAGG